MNPHNDGGIPSQDGNQFWQRSNKVFDRAGAGRNSSNNNPENEYYNRSGNGQAPPGLISDKPKPVVYPRNSNNSNQHRAADEVYMSRQGQVSSGGNSASIASSNGDYYRNTVSGQKQRDRMN